MIITKGNTTQILTNFTENEFFSKSPDAPNEHFLDDKLLHVSQFLRDHFNTPVKVNSTFRTEKHNSDVGGGKSSQHLKGNAIDLSFPKSENTLLSIHQEIVNESSLFQLLRTAGITGFGLYDTFIHLDVRPNGGKQSDNYGTFAFWDNRITTKKKLPA